MPFLRSPLFWITLAVLALVLGALAMRGRRAWGFKDVLKNPERFLADSALNDEAFQRALVRAQTWDARTVAEKVRWFVLEISTSREAQADKRVLAALGAKTHGAVLELLSDPRLRERLATPTGENLGPETPFDRACMLLEERPPHAAIAAVAPFLDAKSEQVRKSAALVLGQTGHPDAVPHIQKAFGDADDYVRAYPMIGLRRAQEAGQLSPECASALVPALMGHIAAGQNVDDAAPLLLEFDRARGTEFLLSGRIFRADSDSLHEVIQAMNAAGAAIPRPMLRELIATLERRPGAELKYPQTYLLGSALEALGRHRLAEDRPALEKLLAHPEERVAEGAAAGLVSSAGLDGFDQRLWEKEESARATLTAPQRHYLAVHRCDAEIKNGGISQYLFNSSGDQWKDALAGFEAMGCLEHAAILREAIQPFGTSGPSEDREPRMKQLSRLYKKNDKLFDGLDSRYYDSKELLAVQATRYVLKNPEAFR